MWLWLVVVAAVVAVPGLPVGGQTVIDVCELATQSDIEDYRGVGVTTESLLTQGNKNRLREIGAGNSLVWTCDYRFVDPPSDVFGPGLSLSVFTDDMPDIPSEDLHPPLAEWVEVLSIPVGDEGYWYYDDDSNRGSIAPLVNPLWARVGECWFQFAGDLGAEHPEDAYAQGLLAIAQEVAERLRDTECSVTAQIDARGTEQIPYEDPRISGRGPGGEDPDSGDKDGDQETGADDDADAVAGGVIAGPPTIVRTRAFNDLRVSGMVDSGDLIFFIFSEAMDIGIDEASTLTVLDADGTLADLDCGNSTIDCTFIVEGDTVDGTTVGNAQAIGMVMLKDSEEFRTHQVGDVPGLHYPLTIMSASADYLDQEGFALDVVGGDRLVENEAAESSGAEQPPSAVLPVSLALLGVAAAGGGYLGYRKLRR